MPFLENNRGHGNGEYDNRYYCFRGEGALAICLQCRKDKIKWLQEHNGTLSILHQKLFSLIRAFNFEELLENCVTTATPLPSLFID